MPQDVASILSESGVDKLGDGKVMSMTRMYRETAFYLYIVDSGTCRRIPTSLYIYSFIPF